MFNVFNTFSLRESPRMWQWSFQVPASSQMEGIFDLYSDIMTILVFVGVLVFILLSECLDPELSWETGNYRGTGGSSVRSLWIPTRLHNVLDSFRPVAYYTHLAPVEFIWTIIPCILLLIIAIPSFTLVLALDEDFRPWFWVKVIGSQWFWTYECSTYSTKPQRVSFESIMLSGTKLKDSSLRLLAVDKSLTIPFNRPTRFLITANDVIHSWAVPALGIKVDACPGRINSVTVIPRRTGIFYGQCSEICGVNHAFMPIVVEVVA